MTEPMPARIVQTDIPGLFDVALADGRFFGDMTTNQVTQMIAIENLVPALPENEQEG